MKKRTWLMWTIFIVYLISAIVATKFLMAVIGGSIPNDPDKARYFSNLSTTDYLASFSIAALNLTGAALLLMQKKEALYFLVAAFAINLVLTVFHLLFAGLASALGAGGVSVFGGLAIALLVCIYAYRLRKNGHIF